MNLGVFDMRLHVIILVLLINQGFADSAAQTSDGAGVSPHTSLEEKQMLPTNLRAELTAQDHQIAELKTKLDHEKLLNQQLENTVSRLQSDNAAHIKTSTARIKELEAKVERRNAKRWELKEELADRAKEIESLKEIVMVSLYLYCHVETISKKRIIINNHTWHIYSNT